MDIIYKTSLLLALMAGVWAKPTSTTRRPQGSQTTCSAKCSDGSKFSYQPGRTYVYKYEVETKTALLGVSDDHSTIGITATAAIHVHSKCELEMQMEEVSVFGYDSKQFKDQDRKGDFANTLKKYPLRFSFQDGVIDSVYPTEGEAVWALNIKKGLLSAFQNSMENLENTYKGTEDDVAGRCDTEYKMTAKGWLSLSIRKTKDISQCSHRQGFDSSIQTMPFRISSGLKSLALLKGTQECDQEINTKGTLTSTVCHELQVFRPFSNGNNGASTETTQKLSLVTERDETNADQVECGQAEPLFFKHAQVDYDAELNAREAMSLLREICTSTVNDVTPSTSRDFSSLVYILKRTNFNGLKRVYNQVNKDNFCATNKDRVRKFAMDAFPMVGTHESVKLMKMLISNKDVTGVEADAWLASLAFINHPSTDMLQEVMQLIGLPSLSTKVLLPLSTMVHSYCRFNPQCMDVAEVKQVIEMIQRNIKGDCVVTQENFQTIMMSLRALGNTGHAGTAIPSLYNCMLKGDNPMDIRVAAAQAFRRMSCAEDRNNLMGLFRNTDEDSELRIAAYLAIMQCPTPDFISQIRQTLADETVNQVGSFVWTHLTNLQESSDPANKYVQHLLNGDAFEKEFDLEKMRFSRNYEGSLYVERVNAGAKADGNLIWSTKSFVPRSASLNLTFDMFGETMNLFEFGGRVEGLDHLLEMYLGPQGYYKDENKGSNNVGQPDPTVAGLSSERLKGIRDKGQIKREELRGAMYLRMFGNELSYTMFGSNNGIEAESSSTSGSDMFNILKKLRNNEKQVVSLTKSFMFVDSTYTVPTLAGLPLNLTVNGTATVALNAGGHVDLKKPRSSVVFEGNFEPSGAVVVDSTMSVDAFVTKGGLKMVSTLHTSTGAQGKLQLTNQNVFDFTFDLTKEKSEIFDVRSEFFMVYDETEKNMRRKENRDRVIDMCSGDKLERVAGIQVCARMSAPNMTNMRDEMPYFPMAGPVSVSIALNKNDLPNGYKLEAKVIKTPASTLFRMMSDTVGSQHDRAIGVDLVVQHIDRSLNLNFISPWKKATMTGQLLDKPTMKGLKGKINVDEDARVYNLDAKIIVDHANDRKTYTPTVTLEIPDWKNIQLNGVINYKLKQKFDADIKITGALDEPIVLETSVMNTDSQVGMIAKYNHKKGDGYEFHAFSKIQVIRKKLATQRKYTPSIYVRTPDEELAQFGGSILYTDGKVLKVDTKLEKVTKDPITLQADMTKLSYAKKKRDKYSVRVTMASKKWSTKLMTLVDYRAGKNINNKNRLDYNFGQKMKDTIITNTKFRMNVSKFRKIYKVVSNVNSMKNNNLDCLLNMKYIRKKFTTNLQTTFKYGKNLKDKKMKERLDLSVAAIHKERNSRYQLNYTVVVKFPPKAVNVKMTGGHIQDGKSISSDVAIKYHPQKTVSIGINLQNKSTEFPSYAGSISLGLPQDREMHFAAAFGKESEDKYISNVEFEIIKGRRTSIDTMLKIATHSMYEVELGVQAPDLEPLRIIGGYRREDDGTQVTASFKRGEKVYSASVQTMMKGEEAAKVSVDVNIPSRHVILVVDGYKKKTETHGMIDIQWDADNNADDRFLTNVTTDFKSWDDFEVSAVLQYPVRKVEFNIKHSSAARYITAIELSWSPEDVLQTTIIFRDDVYEGATRTELSVEFKSPFKGYEDLGLMVSLVRNSQQYQMKSSVIWAPRKKILVAGTAKFPMSIKSVDIVGRITSPFKSYKYMNANIRHRLNDDIDSSALVQWGRNRLSLGVTGQAHFTKKTRFINGSLDFRTPFEGMRTLVVKGQHSDDSRKYASMFSVETARSSAQRDLDTYMMEVDASVGGRPGDFSNTGKIQITIPNDDITTTWEVTAVKGRTYMMFNVMPRRENQFKIAATETHQFYPNRKFLSSFELIIPTQELKSLKAVLEHEDSAAYLKTTGTITKDNVDIFSSDVVFKHRTGSVELMSQVSSKYSDPVLFSVTSYHSLMPYRGNVQLEWAPQQKISIDTSYFNNDFGVVDGSLKITTPFPQARNIVLLSRRDRRGLNWETRSSFSFGPHKKILFDATYRFDHVKLTTVSIKTPFPQFSSLDTSFKIEGSPINFGGEAEFTLQPYVQKVSTDFNWAYYEGTSLAGTFNLNTPYPKYPYMKAKVKSNKLGISRVSLLEVEYIPTQKVIIESDYHFSNIETLEGTLKVTSPYTKNQQVVATFTHIGNRKEFNTDAKITSDYFAKPVHAEAFFSSKKAIKSTFEMDSGFLGYEYVKWNFLHEGKIKDFRTLLEYQTNEDKISYENSFSMKKKVKGQIVLLTPFPDMSRALVAFSHDGKFPNTKSHAEGAFNDKMVSSDLTLSHNAVTSSASALIKTPWKRYKTVTAKIEKSGELNDFSAVGEIVYDLTWHGSIKHKFDGQNILTNALFKAPYIEDDVIMNFNHTGKPLDFESTLEYGIGRKYSTKGNVQFLYALPNLVLESKATEIIGDETRVSLISLKHRQDISVSADDKPTQFDISSKFMSQIMEQKVNIDVGARATSKFKPTTVMNGRFFAVVELPLEDLSYNKIFYEYDVESSPNTHRSGVNEDGSVYAESRPDGTMKSSTKLTIECPLIEDFSAVTDDTTELSPMKISKTTTYSYGDKKWNLKENYERGMYKLSAAYPKTEGDIGTYDLLVQYSGDILEHRGDMEMIRDKTLNIDASLTSSEMLPIVLSYNGAFNFGNDYSVKGNYEGSYGSDTITVRETLRPGSYNLRVLTPFEGFEKSKLGVTYETGSTKNAGDLTMTSSALETPIKASFMVGYNPQIGPREFSVSFSSQFTNFTDIRASAGMTDSDSMHKRHMRVSWEDHLKVKQELLTESSYTWNLPESGTIDVGVELTLKTPYDAVKDSSIMFDFTHSLTPITVTNMALVKHNSKKYLDYDSQFSALNKFTGAVNFRSPRKMAFSLNGLNEGESFDGDLSLNWNQEEEDSLFRLEFGLADEGNVRKVKKLFHVRVTNPGRIVSMENTYENSAGRLSSSGKISWDEAKKQEASYSLDGSITRANTRSVSYDSNIKVTVPARTVMVSGSLSKKVNKVLASTSLLWDADRNTDKKVEVRVSATPYDMKKAVQVDVLLPDMNKEVSLKSELESSLSSCKGQTTFSYSKDDNKDLIMTYNMQKDFPNYSVDWSLDHRDTLTHVKITSSLGNTDSVTNSDAQLQYLTNDSKTINLIFHGELDKDNRVLKIQTTTPDNVMELSGHMTSESPYLLTMKTSHNSEPVWTAVWKVNTVEKTLDGSMTYNDMTKTLTVEAFFPNETSFVSETYRQTDDELLQEGQMSAELNQRHLHGHLKWRPQLINDVVTFSAEVLKELTNQVSSVLGQGSKGLGEEMMAKFRVVSASLKEELDQMSDSLEGEIRLIQKDLRSMRKELKKMHKQNDLYLRSMEEVYTGAVKNMLSGYSKAITKLNEGYVLVSETMEEVSNKINEYPFKKHYDSMMKTVNDGIQESKEIMRKEIDQCYEELSKKLAELARLYNEVMEEQSSYLRKAITGIVDELALTPYMDELKAVLDKYPKVSDVQVQKFINQVHKVLIDAMDAPSWEEKYRLVYERIQKIIEFAPFMDLLDKEAVDEIYRSMLELYQNVIWVYEYIEMDIPFRELLDKLIEKARHRITADFKQLPLGILDMYKSRFTTFDLDNGEIEFDLYLPIPMENFDEMLRFTVNKYISEWKARLDRYFPRRDICLWDFYYSLKPVQWSMRKDWVPPFDVFATVSGSQHYTTFDGSHFDLAGMCSYVLVEDLVDGNFSVVQKYGGKANNLKRESLIVLVNGKTVEMAQTYMVTVDGQPTELPYMSEKLSIIRDGKNVVLESDLGLSIVSNFENDYHVVMLSGWYFGKVGGLLGTYNGEPADDMMMPGGQVLGEGKVFLNAWEVAKSCRRRRNFAKKPATEPSAECTAVFEQSSSSLRPCFTTVQPDHYRHSCDVGSAPLCSIAALYIQTCAQRGITVSLPDTCVKCNAPDNTVYSPKTTLKYESESKENPLQASMDVVFMVEERQCNRDVADKLKKIIFEIEEKLVLTGTTGNRYGLVGYAGTGTYSHTMEGKLFNDAFNFAMGVENLRFNNLGPLSDPSGAIEYSMNLPFRTGVRKMFILVSCSPCQETLGYSYMKLSTEMRQQDITMHVLRQRNFHLKNNRNTDTRIYGIDNKDAFIGRQRSSESDLFSQIDIPSDYCSSMALSSNGSVFDVGHMMSGTVRQRKKFLSKLGGRVGQTAPGTDCQTCTCELDQTGVPRSVCRRCDTKPIYYKPFSSVVQSAVDMKNTISTKLQTMLL